MPGIGNPNVENNTFASIQKYEGPKKSENAKRDRNVGEVLNEIAGAKQEQKFVDKEKHNRLDKDAFLKLLSSQLANQDPFKPVDQKKFAADMAQFAQLEQLTNMNTKLDKSSNNLNQEAKFMGASFIGKAIHTKGASLPYDGERTSVNLAFFLNRPAKNVMVRVFDKANNIVTQIEKESMGQGSNSIIWDGKQLDGARAVKGDYRFQVQAWDDKYQTFMGETKAEGVVTGVTFENGETILEVDGDKKVALRDVDSFFLPKKKIPSAKNPIENQGLKKKLDAAYNGEEVIQRNL